MNYIVECNRPKSLKGETLQETSRLLIRNKHPAVISYEDSFLLVLSDPFYYGSSEALKYNKVYTTPLKGWRLAYSSFKKHNWGFVVYDLLRKRKFTYNYTNNYIVL